MRSSSPGCCAKVALDASFSGQDTLTESHSVNGTWPKSNLLFFQPVIFKYLLQATLLAFIHCVSTISHCLAFSQSGDIMIPHSVSPTNVQYVPFGCVVVPETYKLSTFSDVNCNCNCKYDKLYSTVGGKPLLGCFTKTFTVSAISNARDHLSITY